MSATATLKELESKITFGAHEITGEERHRLNNAYINHAVQQLPKLMEALNLILVSDPALSRQIARDALAKANTVNA